MTKTPFNDNVVIITGASRGIGRELALQLAEHGAKLALAARDIDRLEAIAEICRARSGHALVVQTDVSEQVQCQRLISRTIDHYGRIDTLINNAGITMWALFEDIQDLWFLERIMQVNYFGCLYCTHAALPYIKESRGRIIAVGSMTSKTGVPTRSGYAASKHAVLGFFDSLRIELSGTGVSVTSVFPDFVATETRQRAFGADGKPIGESPVHEDKVMTAEECAALIIKAAAARKREYVMGLRGKIGLYIRPFLPGLIDRIAMRAIKRGQ
jgi:short-subunit dehydrogenase